MTIRDLSVDGTNLPNNASYCIIGGGIAGLLLATRLARRRNNVVVLESGGLGFDEETHALNVVDDPDSRYNRQLDGRYRGLGGSSSRWGGRMIPISAHEQGDRDYLSQSSWPLDTRALDRYHHELEALFHVGHDSFEEIETASPGASGILSADGEDLRARWAKCPTFARCNIVTAFGAELRRSPNLTVVLNATVVDFGLDAEQGRLQAVTARSLSGRSVTIRGDEFAIAAGTIESTRLLLLLEAKSNGHAFARTDALGRYFQDHLKAEVAVVDRQRAQLTNHLLGYRFVRGTRRDLHLELSHKAQRDDCVSSGFVYVSMDLANSGLAVIKSLAHGVQRGKIEGKQVGQALGSLGLISTAAYWRMRYKQLYVPEGINFRLMACVEQLPNAQNRVRLSDTTDRLGVRKVRLEWKPRAAEEHTFQSTVRHLSRYWQRSGFDKLCPLIWGKVNEPDAPVNERAEACAHPSGSTRMGTDPLTSVVRPDLRCHAVPNVAVASASVFPTAGSANPTFTIMKLALWLADSYLAA
jgi:choline dehydrogenase-like flavoprotein